VLLLNWHSGPVQHSTTVVPIYWCTKWGNSNFVGDKVTGLDYLYSHVGGSSYLHTNSEYYDGSGNVNTSSVSKNANFTDLSAAPPGAPSTTAVLNEVSKETGGNPIAGAYYSVYSDQPRGSAGYCAWTINGIPVKFGFFFSLDGDSGCDPGSPGSTGHSQGLAALANVSGHELSEMLTDPQLNLVRPEGQRERRQVRLDVQRPRDDRQPDLEDPGQLEQRGRAGALRLRQRRLHPDELAPELREWRGAERPAPLIARGYRDGGSPLTGR
jgi:hypothetical protein